MTDLTVAWTRCWAASGWCRFGLRERRWIRCRLFAIARGDVEEKEEMKRDEREEGIKSLSEEGKQQENQDHINTENSRLETGVQE